jgi:hypothetical protein
MNLEIAIQRRDQLVGFVQRIMKVDHDFGKIPGTDKNVLLKPGAEKLCTFFGLAPVFVPTATIQDWGGEEHGGEPLFYYRYKCELYRSGNMIATGEGSCSSRESKYRYRKAERVCPQCGKAAIIKGQAQFGGGWLCFKKKDGCGAKFGDKDPLIINQEVGKVFNPDVADLDNTILKMSQKRALIAAVLIGVNASEFFTQDIEDFVEDDVIDVVATKTTVGADKAVVVTQEPPSSVEDAKPSGEVNPFHGDSSEVKPLRVSKAEQAKLHALGTSIYGSGKAWDDARHKLISDITTGATTSANDLTPTECAKLIALMTMGQMGQQLYGEQWPQVSRHNAERISQRSDAELKDLTVEQLNKLIDDMKTLQKKRTSPQTVAAGK